MDPLFGSEIRGRVLEQLALTPRPQTAYRIAKAAGAEPIQVLGILKHLEGVTLHTSKGWVLADATLRRFLRERATRRAFEIRVEKDELLLRYGLRPSSGHGRRRV